MRNEEFTVERHRINDMETSPNEQTQSFRSLGGYLNYEGWPECHRFMELDRVIRLETDEGAAAAQPYLDNIHHSYQLGNNNPLPTPELSLANVFRRPEDMPLRRL